MAKVLRPVARYQGYPAQKLQYRRSPGLEPEYGWVELDYKDLKVLKLEVRAIEWRPCAGFEWPGPITIEAWHKVKGRATVAELPPMKPPAEGGLAQFGDLELMTYDTKGQLRGPAQVFRDVFVHDGTEEMNERLASAREHKEGKVKVPLTDIRKFYDDYGTFIGRINARLPGSPKFDAGTVKNGKTPWSAAEVFEFFFAMLPGSPFIHGSSDLFSNQENWTPPTDIVAEGEPVKQILAQLLERYGLQAMLQPNNSYMVNRAHSRDLKYGEIWTAPNQPENVEKFDVHSEKRALTVIRRPSAVMVLGKRRVRRITLAYVPVFRDPTTGKIYQLSALPSVFGYSVEKLNKQVFNGHEKSFRDVPPLLKKLGWLRAEALRDYAYRAYAPAHVFSGTKAGITDEDLERLPFLPMQDAPWQLSELASLGTRFAGGSTAAGRNTKGDWVLFRPVVMAQSFGQSYFKDWEEIKKTHRERIRAEEESERELKADLAKINKLITAGGEDLNEAGIRLNEDFNAGRAKALYGAEFASDFIRIDQDIKDAISTSGGGAGVTHLLKKMMTSETWYVLGRIKQLAKIQSAFESMLDAKRNKIREWQNEFDKADAVFSGAGLVQGWVNLPRGPVEKGYSLDVRTGLLKFSEPHCHVNKPFLLQPEGAKVATDGAVSVTFGYEINDNSVSDWTSVLFVAHEFQEKQVIGGSGALLTTPQPDVHVVALNRNSAIKPKVEKDPNLQLFEDESGIPFNTTEVVSQAWSRAAGQLGQSRAAAGYTYVMPGFVKVVLDSGCSSIQYEFDGKKAWTHVMIHAPNMRGPLGAGRLPGMTPTYDPRRREEIDRAKENW